MDVTTHVVCRHRMHICNTSFAYLFWLANNKKIIYPEFCMGYIDETWYVAGVVMGITTTLKTPSESFEP